MFKKKTKPRILTNNNLRTIIFFYILCKNIFLRPTNISVWLIKKKKDLNMREF